VLDVKDFTNSTSQLVDFLRQKFPKGTLEISDVRDVLGRQCVDLVQEGGGVHGIALAGYTYVLESMGITFSKAAGTSAGAINTMLLTGTFTEQEIKHLQKLVQKNDYTNFDVTALDPSKFYSTRSEKLLEYLSKKPLSEIVDGHPVWRKILLKMFTGRVKMEGVKNEKKNWIRLGYGFIIFLALIILSSLLLQAAGTLHEVASFINITSIILFVLCVALIASRAWQGRILWMLAERLGINPGRNFQHWIEEKLAENGVLTIDSLREKMEMETLHFNAHYDPQPYHTASGSPAYTIHLSAETANEFENDVKAITGQVTALEAACAAGSCNTKDVDRLWDALLREAKNLPAGDPVRDALARERGIILMPLFLRTIKLIDQACKYVPPFTNAGPYTRELTIISTDISNEIKVEFPAMHKMYWGKQFDMSPAVYVRASMAIPFFFTPFKIRYNESERREMDREWEQFMKVEKRHQPVPKFVSDEDATLFVDGGALSNFPINIYATPEMPIPRKPTIGIKLEFEEEYISKIINSELGEISSIVSTMRYFYDRDFLAKHDMYKRTVRSIDTGQIHWLNFGMSEREKVELFFRGALAAALFLISTHKDFEESESHWHNTLLDMGRNVKAGNLSFSIYENTEGGFRNDDRENPSIRFKWPEYRLNRLLDLSRTRHQRDMLKTFPQ
jgi:NTE family protein